MKTTTAPIRARLRLRPRATSTAATSPSSAPVAATATALTADRAWRLLREATARRYRPAGRHAYHAALGKLRLDPVFRHVVESGLVAPRGRLLDIGCGRGLLAGLLRSCDELAARGHWPAAWRAAPLEVESTGLDADPVEIRRAREALGDGRPSATPTTFIHADMRTSPLPPADTVVMLDVLHYVTPAEQDVLLERVRAALPVGGRLLLRVADATARRGLFLTRWLDRLGAWWRGLAPATHHLRGLGAWRERLESLGFEVEVRPMSAGTPFANVLLVGQVRG